MICTNAHVGTAWASILTGCIALLLGGCASEMHPEDRILIRDCTHQLHRQGISQIGKSLDSMQSASLYCHDIVRARRRAIEAARPK